MKEVKLIEEKYIHRFQMDDGTIKEIETTKEDYDQLGTSEPINPKLESGKWIGSIGGVMVFDTSDGELHEGEWADINGEYKITKVGNKFKTF